MGNDDIAGSRFDGISITRLADSSRRPILGSILGGSLGLLGLKHVADAAALNSRAKCKKIKNKKRRGQCLAKIIALPPQEPDPKAPDQPVPPADPAMPSPPPPSPPPNPPIPTDQEVHLPVRAAFYYPWFPESWSQQGFNPFTNFQPNLGFYDSGDTEVIRQHILAMQYGGIAVGIASWWGVGHRTDTRIPALLASAAGHEFLWALYYEREGQTNPSVEKIQADLTYIRDRYAGDPGYAHIDGKFVVFVYNADDQDCEISTRWHQANTVGAHLVLKVFPNYRTCADQPQGWHQYAPANAVDRQADYSFAISPGFWKRGEDLPRLERDLDRWEENIRNMVASGAPWQLVTTFNEWGEGSSVESAVEWETHSDYGAYLDALHRDGIPEV